MEWLCDQRWFSRPANRFCRRQNGGLAIIFAILLPFIFICCALVFDGSRLLIKRARLADALNEAALAIATASTNEPDTAEKARLNILLDKYINAYLPTEKIKKSALTVSYYNDPQSGAKLPVFSIDAEIDVKMMLPFSTLPSFGKQVTLTNRGKVRKGSGEGGGPADYIFVMDLTSSMRRPSAQPAITRLELLKKVIKDIIEQGLSSSPHTTFALIPFDQGVPVLWDNTRNKTGENELTDRLYAVTACSFLMVPNKEKHPSLTITDEHGARAPMSVGYDINYAFWANKSARIILTLAEPSLTDASLPYDPSFVTRQLNDDRTYYFKEFVLPSLKREMPSAT